MSLITAKFARKNEKEAQKEKDASAMPDWILHGTTMSTVPAKDDTFKVDCLIYFHSFVKNRIL